MTAVIEGEVVGHLPEVLPPDVETKVGALRTLDGESRARAVTAMLSHSRTGLLAAIAAQNLPEIAEFKAKAAAIAEIAKQVRLGKDMQLDAAEFLRCAERGLGVAIREGQARGEILRKGQKNYQGGGHHAAGKSSKPLNGELKPTPTDYAAPHELSGANRSGEGVYAMTDGVTDDQFAEAVAEAKSEGNLSRANVARKCRAKAAAAMADEPAEDVTPEPVPIPPEPTPPKPPKPRLTKHDSTEMLANISGMLTGVVQSVQFMDPEDIDATENRAVIQAIRTSLGAIRRLLKDIEHG